MQSLEQEELVSTAFLNQFRYIAKDYAIQPKPALLCYNRKFQ